MPQLVLYIALSYRTSTISINDLVGVKVLGFPIGYQTKSTIAIVCRRMYTDCGIQSKYYNTLRLLK